MGRFAQQIDVSGSRQPSKKRSNINARFRDHLSYEQEVFCNRTANAVFAFDGYRNGAKGYERGCAFGDRGRI